jgi:solute carrier family 25 protein 44
MFDAFVKIVRNEGIRGLYKGFMVNTMQVVSGIGYMVTYESVRHAVSKYGEVKDNRIKGLIGGGCGSIVSQTIITPFDVVSQHMMVLSGNRFGDGSGKFSTFSNPLAINQCEAKRYGLAVAIIKELYRRDGFRGYYRGYTASLSTYVPSSAFWWMFYPIYTDYVVTLVPVTTSHMAIQIMAGIMSGITVAVITNPLDVVRANIQVQRLDSYSLAVRRLWDEEHMNMFRKGLSARMTQSCISSALIVAGYETLKRWSLYDEYKDKVRW